MIIRQATAEDVDEVKKIIDSLQVSRQQKAWEKANSGFFEYTKTESDLLNVLNPYFIVGETKSIRGFVIGYDNSFLNKNYEKRNEIEAGFLLKQKDNFLYLAQAGVLNADSLGAGRIACSLFDKEEQSAKEKGLARVIGFVVQSPWLNRRSKNLMEKRDYEKFDEINAGNEIVLGAYQLIL